MTTTEPTRDTLYYDGQCGLCTRSAALLRALDWLHRLGFVDMGRTDPTKLPVAYERALEAIPMRTRSGRTLMGYDALRRALLQTPLGAIPALLMYLPGVSHVGRAVYRRIAANRSRNACAIDPAREGD
jgi:predicted DCC family thiol-disulfide oxidoreductase YuxK